MSNAYSFERNSLFGKYENIILSVNGFFGMNFTVSHPENADPAIVGYMVKNPYDRDYYNSRNIEHENHSVCVDNVSASCYIELSSTAYDALEDIMIRAYEHFAEGFSQHRFGVQLNINDIFSE